MPRSVAMLLGIVRAGYWHVRQQRPQEVTEHPASMTLGRALLLRRPVLEFRHAVVEFFRLTELLRWPE